MSTTPPTGIVTFLFTDIQGSTQLLQELSDDYAPVQEMHQRIMRDAIRAGEGAEIRTEGDSFFVVFADPRRAVRAAVDAQRALASAAWPQGRPLRVRMGLHTGEGRLLGSDYLGIDVNRAARIAAAAHGGQIVISDATRALVAASLPDGASIRDLGQHRLKDLAEPERLFDLVIDDLPNEFPELKSLEARPNNLPSRLSSFIGREADIDLAVSLARAHRLVTLTGPGGTGKTRLSLEVARTLLPEFPDGTFFVDLSPIADPSLVPSAIRQAVGVIEQIDRPPLETLRDHFQYSSALLVLDNFEQIVQAGPTVEELLASAPKLHVLVTSRVPLHVYGEEEFEVPPLDMPDPRHLPALDQLSQYEAVALFIDRARAVRRDFAVTNENAPAVAEICVRLDGLPLAIELAASRAKVLQPEEILTRLGQRLPLLTGGAQNLPERQRTLRNAIAWSHDLLDEPERHLFARLAVFSGGASLDAIETVCNPTGELGIDTLDGVASLVDKSLLRPTEAAEARFGMLETIREFAGESLEEAGGEETRRRHARYYLALAEEAEPNLVGEDQALWLDRLEREHDNIRAALRWAIDQGETETAQRLVGALWRFWYPRGHLREATTWLDEVLALPGPRDRVRARALSSAGAIAYWRSDFESTRGYYEEAHAISREIGDREGELEGLYNLGFVPMVMGDHETARSLWAESFELGKNLGDQLTMAKAAANMGFTYLDSNPEAAIPMLEEARAIFTSLGNTVELADATTVLGQAHLTLGHLDTAEQLFREGLQILRGPRNLLLAAVAFDGLANVESRQGRHGRAVRLRAISEGLKETSGGAAPLASIVEDVLTPARAAIGEDAVDRARREGRAMDFDTAVAFALDPGEA